MEFYLVFSVFYVHLVHIFPPNFSVRRHGIQEVSGLFSLIPAKPLKPSNFEGISYFTVQEYRPCTPILTLNWTYPDEFEQITRKIYIPLILIQLAYTYTFTSTYFEHCESIIKRYDCGTYLYFVVASVIVEYATTALYMSLPIIEHPNTLPLLQ